MRTYVSYLSGLHGQHMTCVVRAHTTDEAVSAIMLMLKGDFAQDAFSEEGRPNRIFLDDLTDVTDAPEGKATELFYMSQVHPVIDEKTASGIAGSPGLLESFGPPEEEGIHEPLCVIPPSQKE